jgi:hypothetical protein
VYCVSYERGAPVPGMWSVIKYWVTRLRAWHSLVEKEKGDGGMTANMGSGRCVLGTEFIHNTRTRTEDDAHVPSPCVPDSLFLENPIGSLFFDIHCGRLHGREDMRRYVAASWWIWEKLIYMSYSWF